MSNDVAVRNVHLRLSTIVDARAQALDAESVLDTASLDRYTFMRARLPAGARATWFTTASRPNDEDDMK